MGLYYTLFFGGVIAKSDNGKRERIKAICDEAKWDFILDGKTIIIDTRAASIEVGMTDKFETDPDNKRCVIYGPSSKREEIGKDIYDALVNAFRDYNINPCWLRCEFYSGNMTCNYAIGVTF